MSPPTTGFCIIFIIGSLIVGASSWVAGGALHRRLGLSHAAFGYWFGVWLVAVLPTLAALVLIGWRPEPLVEIQGLLPLPVALDPVETVSATSLPVPASSFSLPATLFLIVWLYVAGLAIALLRMLSAAWKLRRVIAATAPLDEAALPGSACAEEARRLQASGVSLRVTQAPLSPFAVRWPVPSIVLPTKALEHLDEHQCRLVMRHEAAHLARRDPQRAALMQLAAALLWFNPFVRLIAARVQMAAELRCDAFAIGNDPSAGRTLARAYVIMLRLIASKPAIAATALTHRDLEGHALRIGHMLTGSPERAMPRPARMLLSFAGLAAAALFTVVQFAIAAPVSTGHPGVVMGSESAFQLGVLPERTEHVGREMRFSFPLANPRINSIFGANESNRGRPHHGIDLRAHVGTPVLATADGTVVAATKTFPGGAAYGTVVVLDHGNGWQTLYAHLDSYEVEIGERVAHGQGIARSGDTGQASAPHLHLEMIHNGQRVDPESVLR